MPPVWDSRPTPIRRSTGAGGQHVDGCGQFVKHGIDLLGFAQHSQIVGQMRLQLEHFAVAFQDTAERGGQLGELVLQAGDALDRGVDHCVVVLTVRGQRGDGFGQLVLAVLIVFVDPLLELLQRGRENLRLPLLLGFGLLLQGDQRLRPGVQLTLAVGGHGIQGRLVGGLNGGQERRQVGVDHFEAVEQLALGPSIDRR